MSYIVFDVETTIRQSYKRKANPFDPQNRVVWVGYEAYGKQPHFEKFPNKKAGLGWFADMLASNPGTKVLVGFNVKFDVLHAITNDERSYSAWQDFVANGGQLWDVQLAEYLLRGMDPNAHMLSLDETAPLYGGVIKPDQVKEMWAAGIDTPDIPDDLMMEYLPGDIENTKKAFLGQIVKAKNAGQQRSIMVNNGALCFTVEAERNGMAVDKELGYKLAADLERELAGLYEELDGHLPDLPFEFNWGSRTQLSAMLFGGQVNYKTREPMFDDNMEPVYFQRDADSYITADGSWIECEDYNRALLAGEPVPLLAYFSSGKNKGQPKTKKQKLPDIARGQKTRIEERVYSFPGVTEPAKMWETNTPGLYKTGSEVIEALGVRDIPFLKALARRAALEKDLGTYFIKTDAQGNQTGMLTLIHGDGLIHHQINMTSTVTGRFSSSNPNMQNIPKGGKSRIKEVFTSRFGPEGKIIQSDFTSLEIYIQAVLTDCKQMIRDLIEGLDMHVARVATTEGIPYEEAYKLCRIDEVPEWTKKRTKAKVFSFQRAYGAGAAKIALTTGMSIEEVQALIDAEALRYPEVETFYAELGEKITASKTGCRKVIPHPDFPAKQVTLGTGYYRTPDGKLYSYLEQPSPRFVVEREGKWTGFSPTEIKNYIVQGTGAEVAKAACWLLVREFYRNKNWGGRALLINQVHDAAYADSHPVVHEVVAATVHACMELASDFYCAFFDWSWPVLVPTETRSGPNMSIEDKVPNLNDNVVAIKPQLHTRYVQPYIKAA